MSLKNLELSIQKNLKVYLINEVFEKRNYSVADAYFYINILSGHIDPIDTITQSGFYYLNVYNNYGCVNSSDSIYVIYCDPSVDFNIDLSAFEATTNTDDTSSAGTDESKESSAVTDSEGEEE